MRDTITQTYTKEQIIGAVRKTCTPCYCDAEYFIAYYAFEIIKRDILEQVRVVLDKLAHVPVPVPVPVSISKADVSNINDTNGIGNNVIILKNTCQDMSDKILRLASKIGTAHYDAFMLDSRDYVGGVASYKSTEIYKKFFEVRNEAIQCLNTMADIEAQVKIMSSVDVPNNSTDCPITMTDIEACVDELMNELK